MVCPFCTNKSTSVYNSRPTVKLNNVWRRRRCDACRKTFTTTENVDPASVLAIKHGKTTIPFSEVKLLISLLRACDHLDSPETSAYYIAQTTTQKLYRKAAAHAQAISVADIVEAVLQTIKPCNLAAYVKYLSHYAPHLDGRSLKKHLKDSTS